MNKDQKDDSGFIFGIVVGAIIGAVVAIVIHQQDKDEVVRQLKTKINQILNPQSVSGSSQKPSRRQKIKTNQLIAQKISQPKPRSVKKPKTPTFDLELQHLG